MHEGWVGVGSDDDEQLEVETTEIKPCQEQSPPRNTPDSRTMWRAIHELKMDVLALQWFTRYPTLTMSRQSIAFAMSKDDIVKMCTEVITGNGEKSGFKVQMDCLADVEYMHKIWEQCVISRLAVKYWSYGGMTPKYLQAGDSVFYDPDSTTQTPDGHIWTQCVTHNNTGSRAEFVWVFLGFRLKLASPTPQTVVLWASDEYTSSPPRIAPPRCRCAPCVIM